MDKIKNNVEAVEIYTVYDHPDDFPDHYIARRYLVGNKRSEPVVDPKFFMQSKDVSVIREFMEITMGLTKIERDPNDSPSILESYI